MRKLLILVSLVMMVGCSDGLEKGLEVRLRSLEVSQRWLDTNMRRILWEDEAKKKITELEPLCAKLALFYKSPYAVKNVPYRNGGAYEVDILCYIKIQEIHRALTLEKAKAMLLEIHLNE